MAIRRPGICALSASLVTPGVKQFSVSIFLFAAFVMLCQLCTYSPGRGYVSVVFVSFNSDNFSSGHPCGLFVLRILYQPLGCTASRFGCRKGTCAFGSDQISLRSFKSSVSIRPWISTMLSNLQFKSLVLPRDRFGPSDEGLHRLSRNKHYFRLAL